MWSMLLPAVAVAVFIIGCEADVHLAKSTGILLGFTWLISVSLS
jgi:hypothetical protein